MSVEWIKEFPSECSKAYQGGSRHSHHSSPGICNPFGDGCGHNPSPFRCPEAQRGALRRHSFSPEPPPQPWRLGGRWGVGGGGRQVPLARALNLWAMCRPGPRTSVGAQPGHPAGDGAAILGFQAGAWSKLTEGRNTRMIAWSQSSLPLLHSPLGDSVPLKQHFCAPTVPKIVPQGRLEG